jgi:hypothetical protein
MMPEDPMALGCRLSGHNKKFAAASNFFPGKVV